MPVINFIKNNRRILASGFFILGLLSSLFLVILISQKPQDIRSKASELKESSSITEFISSKGYYRLTYDKRKWSFKPAPIESGSETASNSKVIFSLNKDYGFARLDIFEGISDKSLEDLKNAYITNSNPSAIEKVQFQGKPSYLITYKEKILGENSFYYQQLIKDDNKFFVVEKRAASINESKASLENLLQNISFANIPQTKGISSDNQLTTVELVDLIRPSVVNIFHEHCLEIINLKPKQSGFSKPKYNFCGVTKGSGFIVNEKGVVATNGHVVKVYPEEGLVNNLLYESGKGLAIDLIRGVYLSKGYALNPSGIEEFYNQLNSNPQYLDQLLQDITKLADQQIISLKISNDKYFVNLGNDVVKASYPIIPSSTTYTAKILDLNYPNRYSTLKVGTDMALLQLDNPANHLFPSLQLQDKDIKEGAELIIVGFPTLVEGGENPDATISYQTSSKPTITRGIVSAVKKDASGRTVIQTDASIDRGTSGGPGLNSSAEVIGLATFMVESQSGNFNFLRSATDLKELMAKNNLENNLGELTTTWRAGLFNFRNKYYAKALEDFQKVESLNPAHPTVKQFIQDSQGALSRGESLEGFMGALKKARDSSTMLFTLGSISLISFMSSGFLTILPFFNREKLQVKEE